MNDPQTLVQERLSRKSWGFLGGQGYVLGMDIGSYGLRASLIDLAGHTYVSVHREPEHYTSGPNDTLAGALELARGLLNSQGADPSRLVRVGVGFGGPVDARRGVVI